MTGQLQDTITATGTPRRADYGAGRLGVVLADPGGHECRRARVSVLAPGAGAAEPTWEEAAGLDEYVAHYNRVLGGLIHEYERAA